ncbi:rab9 effector protein with kelch motifs-like [Convolutriloba macropyga]|uniref:rab9 effector protein with kelch motifs-like n=1 Tax=Convolutriloba macropyga TaxID=536237 RepID=UPI003F51F49A
MELIPFWEPDLAAQVPDKLWFVVHSDSDTGPGMRTGHGSLIIDTSLLITCGANPDGTFNDLVEFSFSENQWKKYPVQNLTGRYEHTMFSSIFAPEKIFMFAGCTENGNSNEVLSINLRQLPLQCQVEKVSGTPPSARTFCSSSCCDGRNFYVFGGGLETSKATADANVYCLSLETMEWRKLKSSGQVPSPRQGHSVSLVNDSLVCFGGMNAGEFYSDVFVYSLKNESWQKIKPKGSLPCPRAAHASCVIGEKIIVNGGLCLDAQGSLQDVYILNTSNYKWQLVNINGPLPGNRLGHCILPLPDECLKCYEPAVRENGSEISTATSNQESGESSEPQIVDVTGQFTNPDAGDESQSENSNSAAKSNLKESSSMPVEKADLASIARHRLDLDGAVNKFVVFGGLDTSGIIFDDTLLIKLL